MLSRQLVGSALVSAIGNPDEDILFLDLADQAYRIRRSPDARCDHLEPGAGATLASDVDSHQLRARAEHCACVNVLPCKFVSIRRTFPQHFLKI
jgi:hypothetical protein